jgi:hypothetical protein
MPLKPGKSKEVVSQNISEFHKGPTYAHTAQKFGKKKADKQAVAVALENARRHSQGRSSGQSTKYGTPYPPQGLAISQFHSRK